LEGLLEALEWNALQVQRYLDYYTNSTGSDDNNHHPSTSNSEWSMETLTTLRHLYQKARTDHDRWRKQLRRPSDDQKKQIDQAIAVIIHYQRFLKETLEECRKVWARFDMEAMVMGGLLLLGSCCWLFLYGSSSISSSSGSTTVSGKGYSVHLMLHDLVYTIIGGSFVYIIVGSLENYDGFKWTIFSWTLTLQLLGIGRLFKMNHS
jgi:hypothetical protein